VVTDQRKRGCNYYAQPGRRPLPLKRTKQIFTLTESPRLAFNAFNANVGRSIGLVRAGTCEEGGRE
jgi:hypothetical protein